MRTAAEKLKILAFKLQSCQPARNCWAINCAGVRHTKPCKNLVICMQQVRQPHITPANDIPYCEHKIESKNKSCDITVGLSLRFTALRHNNANKCLLPQDLLTQYKGLPLFSPTFAVVLVHLQALLILLATLSISY